MYIKSARITNIRSIEDFEINFEEPAGWHVLIGDNGSGKSTIIRSLALALVGPDEAKELRGFWQDWLNQNEINGMIWLLFEGTKIENHSQIEQSEINSKELVTANITIRFKREFFDEKWMKVFPSIESSNYSQYRADNEFFSVGYGPYRRFTGGDSEMVKLFEAKTKVMAHLSIFGENVALTEPVEWLMKLNYQEVEKMNAEMLKSGLDKKTDLSVKRLFEKAVEDKFDLKTLSTNKQVEFINDAVDSIMKSLLDQETIKRIESYDFGILSYLKKLINSSHFLPNNTQLETISSEGVFFKDGNGNLVTINQLSDGYRSILSLTLELIRQLVRVYGEEAVFKTIRENNPDKMNIDLPGVVLIDEIDAHLHPTWQTKIGQWFLKYFPNIQFIVTTHSPLVCRAAEKGTIWKLAAPGSGEKSEQVTGVDRQRLIFGNVLDAYGTEVFGEDVSRSEKSAEMLKELAALSVKSFKGKITDSERKRADQLKQILPTE